MSMLTGVVTDIQALVVAAEEMDMDMVPPEEEVTVVKGIVMVEIVEEEVMTEDMTGATVVKVATEIEGATGPETGTTGAL